MSDLQLYLFGSPRIEYQGKIIRVERRKALALAAYLALARQPQSRETLAALLWPHLDQEHAHAALRSTLPTLTGLTPETWLDADRSAIALKRDAVRVDVEQFLKVVMESRMHSHGGDGVCETCLPTLKQIVALYQDDFLAGFALPDNAEYEQWQISQREWLRREFSGVLHRLARYYGEQSAYDDALHYARRWLELDPLQEAAHRMLMRLYAANGQRAEALRQYQACVKLLDDELATPPEDETTHLYEVIKTNSPLDKPFEVASLPTASILPSRPNLIVGRDTVLRDLKVRLGIGGETRPVTVIQGWPGVGKSTTVAALAHDPEVAQAFPDGVLWASLGEVPSLLAEILVWANALSLNDPGKPRSLEDITAQITAVLRERRMLLILDDVWQAEHAIPFKVAGQRCAMLFTSRLNDVAHMLAPTPRDVYRLSVLDEEAALDLLRTLTPEIVRDYPAEARYLIRDLEGLPLAIQVAGRLLHSEARLGWGITHLLGELREGAALLAAQAPGDMLDASRETKPTIAALLRRSTASLDGVTAQRFALLGLFVPKPATFDLQAMTAAWDIDDPKPTVRALVNRGLLEPTHGGRFQMHALLVLHAQSLLEQ